MKNVISSCYYSNRKCRNLKLFRAAIAKTALICTFHD